MKFQGYACVTGHENAYDMGWYNEWVAPGAFSKSLRENPDVVLNLNHGDGGSGLPIARTKAGTMRLAEDSHGLAVEADLDPDDPDVNMLARKMERGDLDGQMSFAFRVPDGRQRWNKDYTEREIQECDVHRGDCSIVTQGANSATSSSIDRFRSAALAAGGRSTLPERRHLAEALGNTVIVEMRGFTFAGRTYEVRRAPVGRGRELRAEKYTQSEVDELGKKGQAFGPDAHGHYSFPCADRDDVSNAVRAIGRAGADHNKVRAYVMGRARVLGCADLIPDNWGDDGSLDSGRAASSEDFELRVRLAKLTVLPSRARRFRRAKSCNRCGGDGKVAITCPQCGGDGGPQGNGGYDESDDENDDGDDPGETSGTLANLAHDMSRRAF